MYPDWLRWSRGGEIGSALMLTLWLVLMERLEFPDLQTEGERRWFYNGVCGVKAPPGGEMKKITFLLWATEACPVMHLLNHCI